MVQYRRNFVAGGTYFFTVTLKNRHTSTLTTHIDDLTDAFRKTRETHPFTTIAMVVMPDHIHAIWKLPVGDALYSQRWRMIKSRFTQSLAGVGSVWQPRFWERTVRNDAELAVLVDYIHHNPVKHGLVVAVKDWPHSTFHRFVERGDLPSNWGADVQIIQDYMGE
jgi:putative transposase